MNIARTEERLRRDGLRIIARALEASDAGNAVRRHLTLSGQHLRARNIELDLSLFERISLVSVGKAALPMARAVKEILGDRLRDEIVVTKHGHAADYLTLRNTTPIEAGHPIPDLASHDAARTVNDLLGELNERDLLLVTVSGGASALLSAPAEPITLAEKQQTTDLLLRAGADIAELNAVRKHLSLLKGGRFAALAFPATALGLLLSDVIGDRLDVIGSGLTSPDPSTFADALAILDRYALADVVPSRIRQFLQDGHRGLIAETPKPGASVFEKVSNVIVGSNQLALEAAGEAARELGYRTSLLSANVAGETCDAAREHIAALRRLIESSDAARLPACILSGGETTVTVRGAGKGGRNQEFALASAIEAAGFENVAIFSVGTDGTDGPTDAAGALATGETLHRARQLGMSAHDYLARNDSYSFFDSLGDLIRTGPTGTNVMDIHVMLVG